MSRFLRTLPFLAADAVAFWLLPMLITDTGSGIFLLLLCIPAVVLVLSLGCGALCGFRWYYPLLAAAVFTPTIFVYFNSSAWIYIPLYGVVALVGMLLGFPLHREGK